ncbi:hypothetical protein WKT22_03759 [Candidatus Lokiarchaeum ossiferum]
MNKLIFYSILLILNSNFNLAWLLTNQGDEGNFASGMI